MINWLTSLFTRKTRKTKVHLTAKQVLDIEQTMKVYPHKTNTEIAKQYNVSAPTISRVRNGNHRYSSKGG